MADGRTLATDLRALVNSRKYSDVTFVVGDPEKSVDSFSAHKAVLASRCDYFEELFTAKPDSAILSLPELEGPTFRKVSCFLNNLLLTPFVFVRLNLTFFLCQKVLEFLYTEQTEVDLQFALSLRHASKVCGIHQLQATCEQVIARTELRTDFVVSLLEDATRFHSDAVKARCVEFIAENAKEVCASPTFARMSKENLLLFLQSEDLNAREIAVFQALVAWGNERVKEHEAKGE